MKHEPGCQCMKCSALRIVSIGGTYFRYDAVPSTPVDQGKWRRYERAGTVENDYLFETFADDNRNTYRPNYREASPTMKPGGGRINARVQNVDFTAGHPFLTLDPRPIPKDSAVITRAQIDPWGSTAGKVSWMPGRSAQDARGW